MFATQSGNVNASQLDTNFSQLATAANNLGSYSNYFQDTGVVNAINVVVPAPLLASLTAGLVLYIEVANTNTGPVTISVTGLSISVPLTYPNGAAMAAGQLVAGGIIQVCLVTGGGFQYLGPISSTTGVTSIIAGTGIAVNSSTGNVTISATGGGGSSGNFIGTFNGLTTAPGGGVVTTGAVNYWVNGPAVTLIFPSQVGGYWSGSGGMTITGLPAAILPSASQVSISAGLVGPQLEYQTGAFPSGFVQTAIGVIRASASMVLIAMITWGANPAPAGSPYTFWTTTSAGGFIPAGAVIQYAIQ
jgi:hypothetical protein